MVAAEQFQPGRFVVGLDLGTTNSAMAFVDTTDKLRRICTFSIPQIVAPGLIESRETLPSFHYQPAASEFPADSLALPWGGKPESLVGQFARDHGTLVPGRLIGSAKSWLCHNGVDRNADLLPWQGAEDVDRLSPVAVSCRYLQHFRNAWDTRFPDHRLAEQDFVLTLPASFDEVARELTIKAARQAGLTRVVLIEEPQAAFYAWIDKHADRWDQLVTPGQKILVCDVGGGTTDFTLIQVKRGTDGTVQFHRVAVGDHLILGGDNLDLALAHHLEGRVKPGGNLEPRQWSVLVRSCRHLKEVLLGTDAPDSWTLTLPGSGSKLIGGSIQIPVLRTEVETWLADGFFPDVRLDSKPTSSKSGFQEFGLPYASDAAITRHLASFLSAHRHVGSEPGSDSAESVTSARGNKTSDPARPDILLFNGGVFASPVLRQRLIQSLQNWFRNDDNPSWSPIVLENERLDLAVARGAAYYGMVRRGEGVRIAAGLARTYYIGVDHSALPSTDAVPTISAGSETGSVHSALCLLPAGIEPGHEVDLSRHQFQLLVSQPIEFPLYVSSIRLTDRPGDLVSIDPEQIKALPPIRTVLKTGKSRDAATIAVILRAKLTEIGTLDLWCSDVEGKRSWKLLFDVRSATQTDVVAHDAAGERQGLFDDSLIQSARAVIVETFGLPLNIGESPGEMSATSGAVANVPDKLSGPNKNPGTNSENDPIQKPPQRANDNTILNPSSNARRPPAAVVKGLVDVLGLERDEWPTSILRQLWQALIECEQGRSSSAEHEARWLNLTGFSLRPGYGMAIDDWRCNETWKLLQGKLRFATTACRVEWHILWRRIAGGLTAGQQQALAAPLMSQLKQAVRQPGSKGKSIDFGTNSHESSEAIRLLGACELLSVSVKRELGDLLLELLGRPRFDSLRSAGLWSLGRIGARRPVYGPLNTVVPPDQAGRWLTELFKLKLADPLAAFAMMQLSRMTGDRYRDLDSAMRDRVFEKLDQVTGNRRHYRDLVANVAELESDDESMIFGESLPKGLRIL